MTLLRITPRAAELTISADPTLEAQYSVTWDGPTPRVREHGDAIEIDYPVLARLQTMSPGRGSLSVALNPAVDWAIELDGGVSDLRADLRDLRVSAIDIGGGAKDVVVELPEAEGELPLRVAGGASRVVVRRPTDVPVSVEIDGGATDLRLDDAQFGAIGGAIRQRAGGAATGAGEVALRVLGGASRVTVDVHRNGNA
jgi:hypothetical protein